MATAALRRAMSAFTRPPDPSDADLLRQFAASRSETAFAALVRRHGPLVLGVCRRVVPDTHLADDAFQAAFVVLARRAGGIDPTRPLGPWLYAVAHRVALRARTMIGRRRTRETLAAELPDVPARSPGGTGFQADEFDRSAILDDEIAKLPDPTREAVVLCELQGLTRRQAAARLGIAEGTLSSRLASARKTLAARLQARGVMLSVALASAVVSSELATAAVNAGTGAVLTSVVTSLADGAPAMTLLNKLKLTAVVVLFTLLSVGGIGPWRANETSAAPVPKEKAAGPLVAVWQGDAVRLFTPDGTEKHKLSLDVWKGQGGWVRLSPDGKRLAVRVAGKGANRLVVVPLGSDKPDLDVELAGIGGGLFWHPDGSAVGLGVGDDLVTVDAKTGKLTAAKRPDGVRVLGVLADGRYLADRNGGKLDWRAGTLDAGLKTFEPFKLNAEPPGDHLDMAAGASADGKRVALARYRLDNATPFRETVLSLLDVDGGTVEDVLSVPGAAFGPGMAATSADGEVTAVGYKEPSKALGRADADRHSLAVYRRSTGKLEELIRGSTDPIRAVDVCVPARQHITAPVPKAKADAGLIWTHNTKTGELTAYTPDGDTAKTLKLKDGKHFFGLTPDGTHVAFVGQKGKPAEPDAKDGLTLHLRPVSDATEGTDTGLSVIPGEVLYWSPDGTQVVRRRMGPDDKNGGFTYEHVLFDVTTKKEKKVELPVNQYVIGWAADGKTWHLHEYVRADLRDPKLPRYRVLAVPAGGGKPPTPLCDTVSLLGLHPAADGKSFHAVGHAHANPADDTDATYLRWFRVGDTGQATLIKTFTEFADIDVRPSPDRTRLACLGRTSHDDTGDTVLRLYDPDGSNERKLVTLAKDGQDTRLLGWFPNNPAAKADPKAKPPVKEPIKAPVPKAKAKLPEKLARVPEAPPELAKELAGWDEKYRHGSAGGFAELEKRADAVAKEYTDHDQARIWYAVAHIAAQSGIGKQADRVRQYAEKCLKISRDPLDRGNVYSYLASCEDLGKGEFAARRRKAADWLLTGYLELLVQELPDEKPELPGVQKSGRILGDGADDAAIRARVAAQVAAREQAVWVNDQIARRDALVLCFRNEYEPHPKAHGHGPDGPAELRKLAEAKLPTPEDVDTLLKRVLPNHSWDDAPKAKPPVKEPIKAPVPAVKENAMGLTASVLPEKDEIMLGEPMNFTFTVTNPTDKGWGFDVGGDYRNRLGRPNSFTVDVTGPGGKKVPQPDSGPDMGGLSHGVKLPPDGKHTFTLFLPHWATFDTPGEYTISVRRKLTLVPLDPAEREKAKPEVAAVVAAGKVTVVKADAKKFGDLIATLGGDLFHSQRSERATKMLLEIQDERVVPHFVGLGSRPRVEARYAACDGLKKFKTDEAFTALKAIAATTADDLKGSAINRQLEESSARAVRHSAVSALAACPHPDALPLVWRAVDDESDSVRLTVLHKAFEVKSVEARKVIEKLTEDADERVRDEAKRYAGLLAKEKT